MSFGQHVLFLLSVGIAGYVQNLTGFAFGLVLLGLVGLTHAASIPDVANVVGMLTLVNAAMLFAAVRPRFETRVLGPTLAASLIGVLGGVWLLNWLSHGLLVVMTLLLGLTIIGCAATLARPASALARLSSPASFAAFGAASGVLGGVFSTAGPPLVYHLYRQPMPLPAIRETLVAVFAANALLRLALLLPSGHVSANAMLLSLETVPLVLVQTWWMARNPPGIRPSTAKRLACLLMALVGIGLVLSSWRQLAPF